jgi:hypothetical protein
MVVLAVVDMVVDIKMDQKDKLQKDWIILVEEEVEPQPYLHHQTIKQVEVPVVPESSSSPTQHKYLKTSNVYRKTPTNWTIHQT